MRLAVAAVLMLAACGEPAPSPEPSIPPAAPVQTPSPPPAAEPDKSPQGALAVADAYFDLLRRGEYARAWTVWPGAQSDVSQEAFIQRFAAYSAYDAKLGTPGPTEGAAGSIYIDIPVAAAATLKSGGTEQLSGSVSLRRVNDVDGSTLAQRTWHIHAVELASRP